MIDKLIRKENIKQDEPTVQYYIACRIPRLSDCDERVKCRRGEWCYGLEILESTDGKTYWESYSDELYPTYESAQEALKKIKEATLKKEKEE